MKALARVGILVLVLGFLPSPAQDVAGIRRILGRAVFCRALGGGEPLLIVHGGPGLAHDYLLKPFSQLAGKYKLVFYDQRGCGLSDGFMESETVAMDGLVDELEAVRKEFALEKMYLAGQSWGALIAINYTLKHPGRVKKLLLLEPAPGSSEYLPALQQAILARLSPADKEELAGIARDPSLASDPALYIRWMNLRFKAYYFDPQKQDMDKLAYFDGARVRKAFASSAMFGPYLADFDLFEKMKAIGCPVLIVHGDHDVIPAASALRMKQALINAELVTLKDCGHFAHVEKERDYFAAIRSFLERQ